MRTPVRPIHLHALLREALRQGIHRASLVAVGVNVVSATSNRDQGDGDQESANRRPARLRSLLTNELARSCHCNLFPFRTLRFYTTTFKAEGSTSITSQ